jgi:iron-sulfur cluster assembly protein
MITLTPRAAERVRDCLSQRGHGLGIRIGVKTTGCSGLAYVLEYVDVAPSGQYHVEFESQAVKIWVDSRSLPMVRGLHMDWVTRGLDSGFDFVNPNERDRCGCGLSFRV